MKSNGASILPVSYTHLIVEAQGIFLPKDIIPAAFRIGNPSHLFLWEPGLPEGRKVLFIMNELLGLPHTKGSRPILLGCLLYTS